MAVEKAKNIPPFVRFCTASVPMVFDNSMSYYECLCALTKFLQDNVINVINNNAEQLQGLLDGFNELKDYVDNYFANLDVQSEIDAKLDEMAEGGQLATIIAQFLAAAPVFAYGTIAGMAAATNLNNGCIARVIGNTSAAAGDGAYYLIRDRIESDDPDGVNLVAIGANLVGVRVQDAAVNSLQSQIDELKTPKKYLFIGDSYASGYTGDGQYTPWTTIVKNKLGLSSEQYMTAHSGGLGFSRSSEYNYYTLINNLDDDSTITDIVIGGGYNDQNGSEQEIYSGIGNVRTLCHEKFPNAKLYIAAIGWSRNMSPKTKLQDTYLYYKKACDSYGDICYLMNTQYALHNYFTMFSSDGVHPNALGQEAIGTAVADALRYGAANIFMKYGISLLPVNNGGLGGSWSNTSILTNDYVHWNLNTQNANLDWSGENATSITISGKAWTKVADITGGFIIGDSNYSLSATVPCVLRLTNNDYESAILNFAISQSGLYVHANFIKNNVYEDKNVKLIQLGNLSISGPTMVA